MTTAQLVSLIRNDFVPNWSRVKILDVINTIQGMMFSHDCVQHIFQDTSVSATFPVPILKTVAGTLEYPIIDANLSTPITINNLGTTCRRVSRVFIKYDNAYQSGITKQYAGEEFTYTTNNAFSASNLLASTCQKIPCRLIDKRGIQDARVIFPEDPGTHNDRYFIEFYLDPVELTSEAIGLSINPAEWFDTLLNGIVGYVEKVAHGESKAWDEFRTSGLRSYWEGANRGNENKEPQIAINE